MTVGQLYELAGPFTATLMLVFTPVGVVATFYWLLCKIMPIRNEGDENG